MSIEYFSIALGLVGIGLFFFGFVLGQKSSSTSVQEKADLSFGVKLAQAEKHSLE